MNPFKAGDRVKHVLGDTCTVERVADYEAFSFAPPETEPKTAPTKKQNVCEEANVIAGGDRQRDYGHPLDNHERIAGIWNVVLGDKLKKPITAEEAALCMCGLKIAREINTPKRDNLVDLCGYAKCLESMYDERKRRVNNSTTEAVKS